MDKFGDVHRRVHMKMFLSVDFIAEIVIDDACLLIVWNQNKDVSN